MLARLCQSLRILPLYSSPNCYCTAPYEFFLFTILIWLLLVVVMCGDVLWPRYARWKWMCIFETQGDIYRMYKWVSFGVLHFVRPPHCINVRRVYLGLSCVVAPCCVREYTERLCLLFYLLLSVFSLCFFSFLIQWMIIFGVYFSRVFLSLLCVTANT